jgi:GR25 family glycosyltransferase involved in LPS biosynthesis
MEGINDIFVINLKRRLDRWKLFENEIYIKTDLKVSENIIKIEGVDGLNMKSTEEVKFLLRYNTRKSKGEFGCALSHINLWKKISKENDSYKCIIFEDDVFFYNNFHEKWKDIYHDIPKDCGFLYLHLPYGRSNKNTTKYILSKGSYQVFTSYMITPKIARILLRNIDMFGIYKPIDVLTQNYSRKHDKKGAEDNFYYLKNPICYYKINFMTDIQGKHKRIYFKL